MRERTRNGTVYEQAGPEVAPVVVLIHGLGLNRQIWQAYHAVFAAGGYRVLYYDLFGHGESVPPPGSSPPGQVSLSVFSAQLCELLDTLGIDKATIVGFSLGGMINRRFAMDYPERVRALAILNSPHERSPAAQQQIEARAAETAEGGPAANLDATLERWFTVGFRSANADFIHQIRQWVLANDPVIYAQCRQVLATGVIELIRPHPPIAQPTLVITAENDSGSTPDMSHAIAAEMPGAQTIIVPDLQHMGLVERPDKFTVPLLQFFDEIGLRD